MPNSKSKILSLEDLSTKANNFKKDGNRIVLCHGTFDLSHAGHIRHLQSARKEGDALFVTVTGDQYVNKGPGRPVFPEVLRAENIAALTCVDFVSINYSATAVNILSKIKPDAYVKGSDYKNTSDDLTGNIIAEKNAVEACGGEIVYTEDITFSSSSLLNEYFGVFPTETQEYLEKFRKNYSSDLIISKLRALEGLDVLVIGDAIIDEYCYTVPLGQSAKGTHLSVKYGSSELFAGGALAVANHIAGFVNSVTLVTGLGKKNNHEDFIRSKLATNVKPQFFYFEDAPTVVKRRFVDGDLNKLFEVYYYNEKPDFEALNQKVCPWLAQNASGFDMVCTPDFGDGFISSDMIDQISSHAGFLVVNTQVNSGNRGYHAISRYPRADFISLNGPELRMATHNRFDPLETVAEAVADNKQAKYFAVTLGSQGAILLDREQNKVHKAPVLSTKVLDRIGAGDTFLSLAGICLKGGLSGEIALFVASAAAALDVQVICNRESTTPVNLFKYIATLLK